MKHNKEEFPRLKASLDWVKNNRRCLVSEVPPSLAAAWLSSETLGLLVFLENWLAGRDLKSKTSARELGKELYHFVDSLPVEAQEKFFWWKARLARLLVEHAGGKRVEELELWNFSAESPDCYVTRVSKQSRVRDGH